MNPLSIQILGAYIGSKCTAQSNAYSLPISGTLSGINSESAFIRPDDSGSGVNIYYKNGCDYECDPVHVRLVLVPLHTISDEHATEYDKLARTTRSILNKFNDQVYTESALVNYLRSKGYDCDNLIAKGMALDATIQAAKNDHT